MMKTNRFFAMAIAMTMLAGTAASMSSFAAEDSNLDDKTKIYKNYTKTDIDVAVDAELEGTGLPAVYSSNPDSVEDDIKGEIGHETTPQIYVEVEWDEMEFVYDFGSVTDYKWNREETNYEEVYTYKYGDKTGPAWKKTTADIYFTSYSNRDVYVGVSFDKYNETYIYKDVNVTFGEKDDNDNYIAEGEESYEILLYSAALRGPQGGTIEMKVDGAPDKNFLGEDVKYPSLGNLIFYISEEHREPQPKPAEEPAAEENSGEHEHHYVYDQFGRLVCTGCNAVKHTDCIDEDEDGLCDECGLERDFCPDCHIGGTCRCI